MNKEKRAAYDQFGHAGVDPSMGGGGFREAVVSATSLVMSSVIFWRCGRGRAGPQRGSDSALHTGHLLGGSRTRATTVEIRVPSLNALRHL